MWTSTTVRDALVQVDDTPLWVRVSAVEAVGAEIEMFGGGTFILLAGGRKVETPSPVEDVIEKLSRAMKADG